MKTLNELFEKFPVLDVNEEVYLRQFSLDDAKNYFNFYSIPEVNKFIPDSMIPLTLEDAKNEINSIIRSFKNKQDFYWAIAEKKTNKLIGGCGFHNWSRFNMGNEIAYDLHPDYWKKGITTACLKEIIKFAFLNLGVYRIQATTVEENEASNKLLLKIGFKYEGVLRRYKFFKKQIIDVLMFSYTIEDFKRDISLKKY